MAAAENYDNADKVRTLGHQVSYDHRSYERNKSNCVQRPENVRTSNGVWHQQTNSQDTQGVTSQTRYLTAKMYNSGFRDKINQYLVRNRVR